MTIDFYKQIDQSTMVYKCVNSVQRVSSGYTVSDLLTDLLSDLFLTGYRCV